MVWGGERYWIKQIGVRDDLWPTGERGTDERLNDVLQFLFTRWSVQTEWNVRTVNGVGNLFFDSYCKSKMPDLHVSCLSDIDPNVIAPLGDTPRRAL